MSLPNIFSRLKDLDIPVVIAEIGNNHEGNLDIAEKMIISASKTGVHAVKFQTFITKKYISSSNKERFKKIKSFELSFKQFERLKKVSDKHGVSFLSTPLDLESAEFLCSFCEDIKISSGDNTFWPLLDKICQYGINIIISCGLVNFEEIDNIYEFIKEKRSLYATSGKLALLHCTSEYPVEPENANLRVIPEMIDRYKTVIGFSDHSIGIQNSILASVLGAKIIEKHFTLDKNYSDFRDHKISADPNDLFNLIEELKQVEKILGSKTKRRSEKEQNQYELFRRSAIAMDSMPAGTVLTKDKISWVRPAGSLSPEQEDTIVGKTLIKKIKSGHEITEKNLK